MSKRQQVLKFASLNHFHAKGYKGGLVILSDRTYSKCKTFESWEEIFSFLINNPRPFQ